MYWGISDPGMGSYPARARRDFDLVPRGNSACADSVSPSQSPISQRGWHFHTVRGGIDPGDHCFIPGSLELYVYEVRKDFGSGDGLSSPGAAGPRRWPEGNCYPCVGSMSPPNQRSGNRAGRYRPAVSPFVPVVGVVLIDVWKTF